MYRQIGYDIYEYRMPLIPEELDPYETLGIKPTSSFNDCKMSFLNLITKPSRYTRIRASLAYDILCNKQKYIKKGNLYRAKKKDHFYCVVVGDLDTLKRLVNQNKKILLEKDDLQRSLLYLAARNGFFNICEFLLKNGANINETQKDGSTPLHGAAFYNQEIIVQLLLEYGAKTNIKNNFNDLASDDARSLVIKNNILNSQNDQISILSNYLINKKLAKKLVLIKYKNKIIGKKIMRSEYVLPSNIQYIKEKWEPAFHGTKFNSLKSIMKYGLIPSG